jgi:hypothetical protein
MTLDSPLSVSRWIRSAGGYARSALQGGHTKRSTVQLAVSLAIIVAFLVTALSGLVLMYPGALLQLVRGTLLGWRSLHDWGALMLTVAVLGHVVLNRRRIGEMMARLWRPASSPTAAPAPPPAHSLESAAQPGASVSSPPDPASRLHLTRRRFLLLAGGALAALLAILGLKRLGSPGGGSGAGGGIAGFPVLNVEDGPPAVAPADWVIVVDGLVETPLRLERSAWLTLPRTVETRDFHCVEGWSVGRLGWEGVSVAELLSRAKPQARAQFVTFHAHGGSYSDSLTLSEAKAPETLLADALDGKPLPPPHGGPLRLVIPTQLGYKNVKWVVRLELTATRAQGYWEGNGYPAEAPVS